MNTRPRLVLFAFFSVLCAPLAAQSMPEISYDWGASYGRVRAAAQGMIIEEQPGRRLRIRVKDMEYLYSFYRRYEAEAGGSDAKKRNERGGGTARPIDEVDNARLFAVSIHFNRVPFEDARGEEILRGLESLYGKAVARGRACFDMEGDGTLVRAYFDHFSNARYLIKLVFVSSALTRERNAHIRDLERAGVGPGEPVSVRRAAPPTVMPNTNPEPHSKPMMEKSVPNSDKVVAPGPGREKITKPKKGEKETAPGDSGTSSSSSAPRTDRQAGESGGPRSRLFMSGQDLKRGKSE